jgi:hypothetical protein
MRSLLFLPLLLLAGCSGSSSTPIAAPVTVAAPPQPVLWKYTILVGMNFLELKEIIWSGADADGIAKNTQVPDALNAMGAKGWELVTLQRESSGSIETMFYYFKQPR